MEPIDRVVRSMLEVRNLLNVALKNLEKASDYDWEQEKALTLRINRLLSEIRVAKKFAEVKMELEQTDINFNA